MGATAKENAFVRYLTRSRSEEYRNGGGDARSSVVGVQGALRSFRLGRRPKGQKERRRNAVKGTAEASQAGPTGKKGRGCR